MDISDRKLELIARLHEVQSLVQCGFTVEADESGAIVILRDGHVYGIWLVRDDDFAYVPGGYNEPTLTRRLLWDQRSSNGHVTQG